MPNISREAAKQMGILDQENGDDTNAQRKRPHKREIGKAQKLSKQHPHLHIYVTDQVGRNHGSKGIPDCLVFYMPPRKQNRFIFWECKASESDKLRPAQKAFRALCEVVGIKMVVGTLDDLLDELGIEA